MLNFISLTSVLVNFSNNFSIFQRSFVNYLYLSFEKWTIWQNFIVKTQTRLFSNPSLSVIAKRAKKARSLLAEAKTGRYLFLHSEDFLGRRGVILIPMTAPRIPACIVINHLAPRFRKFNEICATSNERLSKMRK